MQSISESVTKLLFNLLKCSEALSSNISGYSSQEIDDIELADKLEKLLPEQMFLDEQHSLNSQLVEYIDWEWIACRWRNKELPKFRLNEESDGYVNSLTEGIHRWLSSNESLDYYYDLLTHKIVLESSEVDPVIAKDTLARLIKAKYVSHETPKNQDLATYKGLVFLLGIELVDWQEIAECYIQSTRNKL